MYIYFILIIISAYLYMSAPPYMSRGYELICMIIAAVGIFAHFRIEINQKINNLNKIYLRHSVFFILCFSIVFFQYHIDYILGFVDDDLQKIWIDTKYVSKALSITILVLNSFFLGYHIIRSKERNNFVCSNIAYTYRIKKQICYIGYAMLLVYLLTVDKDFLNGGYAKGAEMGEVNVIIVLLQSVIIATVVLYCEDFKGRIVNTADFVKKTKLPLGLILLYIITIIISGRRGGSVRMFSLLLIMYIYLVHKVNYKRLFLIAIVVGFVFSIVGATRQMDNGSLREGMNVITSNYSVSPFTKELAGSIQTFHVAVSNFPQIYPFNYGITFFPGFLVLIPGAERLYREVLTSGVPMGSGDVLTMIYFNDDPQWGLGSSLIADSYISFGTIGSIILFFILGRFLRYLEVETFCRRRSPYILALSFCCYSQFLIINRGSFNGMFLSVSYSFIIIYFARLFTERKTNRKFVKGGKKMALVE